MKVFFYSRREVAQSSVADEKLKIIQESGIAIYRFHDYFHKYKSDGIMEGIIQSLNWEAFVVKNQATATILEIPAMSVREVIDDIKEKLDIGSACYVGDLSMTCNRISLLVGYREGAEWKTPEYVRDAISHGKNKALIILGHLESEEPGMQYLAHLQDKNFPQLPVYFILTNQCIHIS